VDQGVGGILQQHVATAIVAALVLGQRAEERPGADVVPARVHFHQGCLGGFLHHGVVDRVGARGLECRRIEAQEIQVFLRPGDGLGAGFEHRRVEPAQLVEKALRPEQEHAAVPQVLAASHIGFGAGAVRLFDESADGVAARGQGRAFFQIAVAGLGAGGFDAKSGEPPFGGEPHGGRHRGMEGL